MAQTTQQKNTQKDSYEAGTAVATLKTYRQSPRKVRLIADAIRGKKAHEAMTILEFAHKRAAAPVQKLLASALANAKQQGLKEDELVVTKMTVDGGPILYRRRARARGSAYAIRKRTSHVHLELTEKKTKKD